MSYIYVGIAVVLLAFEFACSKKYQSLEGTQMVPGLRFNALVGLLSAVTMLIITGFRPAWSAVSLALAIGQAACCIAYSLIGFQVLKMGGMALYSTFLMSGGMLLPYFVGVAIWNEQLNWLRIVGVVLILGAVILSNFSKERINKKLIALCCAVFVLNGFVSILSKYHQILAPIDSTNFAMYAGAAKFLLCALVLLFCRKAPSSFMQNKRSYWVIAATAVVCGTSYLLQLMGAKDLPATVLYPMITGGCVVMSALAGVIFFKEKLSKLQLFSILLCLAGTLFFL